jgi:hypothetical protein
MDQLICPECNEPAGFNICDSGVPTTYSVSADREVQCEDAVALEADILITCLACDAEPDGDLWDEIYKLYRG